MFPNQKILNTNSEARTSCWGDEPSRRRPRLASDFGVWGCPQHGVMERMQRAFPLEASNGSGDVKSYIKREARGWIGWSWGWG